MRIEYAMKSAPQSEAELLAIYKGSHGRLRGVSSPPIVKIAEPEPILVEPQLAEPVQVPTVKKESSHPKWSFIVDKGSFGLKTIAETPAPSITYIMHMVAKKYGVDVQDLKSEQKVARICWPRQIAVYLCDTLARRSLPTLGRAFGRRDHTTMISSRNKITRMMAADEDFEKEIHDLKQVILDTYREVAP